MTVEYTGNSLIFITHDRFLYILVVRWWIWTNEALNTLISDIVLEKTSISLGASVPEQRSHGHTL